MPCWQRVARGALGPTEEGRDSVRFVGAGGECAEGGEVLESICLIL